MRKRFPSIDNRNESELLEEARLIFDSQSTAFTEILIAHIFGGKTFLKQAAARENRLIRTDPSLLANDIAERAYFVDCLHDDLAAFAERWEDLRQNARQGLGPSSQFQSATQATPVQNRGFCDGIALESDNRVEKGRNSTAVFLYRWRGYTVLEDVLADSSSIRFGRKLPNKSHIVGWSISSTPQALEVTFF